MHDLPAPPSVFVERVGHRLLRPVGRCAHHRSRAGRTRLRGDHGRGVGGGGRAGRGVHPRGACCAPASCSARRARSRRCCRPFKLGVGGRLGPGTQWMPWISVDDWVGLTSRLITNADARGAFNLSAPAPVTNAEFTRTLGTVLRRPTVVPVPALRAHARTRRAVGRAAHRTARRAGEGAGARLRFSPSQRSSTALRAALVSA